MGTVYNTNVVTDGIVAIWDAANRKSYPTTGTAWADLTGNGNNSTLLNGPTFDSANGGSIVFDGSDDIALASNPSITSVGTVTICIWINPTRNSGWESLVDFGNDNWLLTLEDGEIKLFDPNFSTGTTVPIGQWTHVAMSHLTGGGPFFYMNGSFIYTSSDSSLVRSFSTISVAAGWTGSPNEAFQGKIAAVQIYDRALSAAEIAQNYNATKGRFGL